LAIVPSASAYSPREERFNIVSHAIGLAISVLALTLLVNRSVALVSVRHIVSFSIFGASLVLLFLASTLYHSATDPVARSRLRILDHASIYILIAGTYTPFILVTLHGSTGWILFGISWSHAIFHLLVLTGASCHFMAVYSYV
jgi:hemolysin III